MWRITPSVGTATNIRRAAIVLVSTFGMLAFAVAQPMAAERTETLTRVQLRVETTSDWTSVRFSGADIRVKRVSEASAASKIWPHESGFTVVSDDYRGTLIADLVLEVPAGVTPGVTVEKGRWGVAEVTLLTTNGSEPAPVLHAVLDTQDPHENRVHQSVDAGLLVGEGLPVEEIDGRDLVLAFYYPWFDRSDASDRRIAPDKPASPFATNNDEDVASMVAEASGAGVDGFVISWQGSLHGEVVDKLLAAVHERPGFVVAPLLELQAMTSETLLTESFDPERAAADVRDFFGRVDDGSVLRVDGRPVVVTHGMWELTPEEWARFRAATVDLDLFVVGDYLDPLLPVDGIHLYDPNSRTIPELAETYDGFVDRARLAPSLDPGRPQLLWAATVSPGFDNRASRLLGRQFTDREEGRRYDETWKVAVESAPEWVFVTSWNEWYEQTHIQPGTRTGGRALEQTSMWSDRFAVLQGS